MSNRPEDRLKRFSERQGTPAWGKDYQPAIRATPKEAPRISRPSILRSEKLGRDVHLLSQPETKAAYLALHHPNLFDLHEQRLLSTIPASHPLQGSPAALGLRLQAIRGTVDVAERLGMLNKHPKAYLRFEEGEQEWVPLPYVGDLLLYLSDSSGPYCVNWTIKLTQDDFLRRGPRLAGRPRRATPTNDLRHRLEEEYYKDAGIRTVRLSADQLDGTLIANLRFLFGWHNRPEAAQPHQREALIDAVRCSLDQKTPAFKIVVGAAAAASLDAHDALVSVYRAIWARDLKVDLFSPLIMSSPMKPERETPFERYTNLFRR